MEDIKKKGFTMTTTEEIPAPYGTVDFNKISVGLRTLNDATLDLGVYKKIDDRCGSKEQVLKAIYKHDLPALRKISDFYYHVSGIYMRLVRYLAYMYRYDWVMVPFTKDVNIGIEPKNEKVQASNETKLVDGFYKALFYLDNFSAKQVFGKIAFKVIKYGCFYGYIIPTGESVSIQELPPLYCRSRYKVKNQHAIEFNMKFFDDYFPDTNYRERILNLFPKEFKKGYRLFKQGKLKGDFQGDKNGWYLLTIGAAVKFNINDDDTPFLISVIPAIIDLDGGKDLNNKSLQQKLLKLIIQKMPIDKNGDLVFDVDEARELHNNAVNMLGRAIGIDVLTTFADVDVADMAKNNTVTSVDELDTLERQVYNEGGISQLQFNTDGNIALEKSILNDEATIWTLITQFEDFLNFLMTPFNKKPKKFIYKVSMLPTTIYNYKDLAKLYKDNTSIGFSKMLPQVALGQSQLSVLSTAYFENQVLDLVNVFIPPLSSNTMSPDMLTKGGDAGLSTGSDSEGAGRPEKPDDEKSEKTIMNKESQS